MDTPLRSLVDRYLNAENDDERRTRLGDLKRFVRWIPPGPYTVTITREELMNNSDEGLGGLVRSRAKIE